jgi:hypothetical protein
MREQTERNAGYFVALHILNGLAARLGWNEEQFETARAELVRCLQPTLAEV